MTQNPDWDLILENPNLRNEYKRTLFQNLTMDTEAGYYIPHAGQELIHFEDWQYHTAVWGRRAGKTQGAAAEVCEEASFPHRYIWVVAPTYTLTDKVFRLVYHWLVDLEALGAGSVRSSQYNPRGQRKITLEWGTVIEGKTADSPKSLLGEGLDLIVFDEAAQSQPEIWNTYLEPTLVDRKGRILFITTPRGYNWIYDLWCEGMSEQGREEGWFSSRIKSEDNPYLDKEFIQKKKRRTDRATYQQEYEASFEAKKGVVYGEYIDLVGNEDRQGHLFDPDKIRISDQWTHYRAIDPGLANPTACIWAAVSPHGDVYVYDEYEVSNVLVKDHAANIAAKTRFKIVTTYIDPSAGNRNPETGRTVQDTYRENGIYTVPSKHEQSFGIQTVAEYMRATLEDNPSHPRLYISEKCYSLRKCLVQYEFAEHATLQQKNDPDRPRQYKDHLPDALRYLLASNPAYIPPQMRHQWQVQEDEVPTNPPGNREYLERPQV